MTIPTRSFDRPSHVALGRWAVAVVILATFATGCGSPVDVMKASTVRIVCSERTPRGPHEVGSGSGFVVAERHVVTNWHVIRCASEPGIELTIHSRHDQVRPLRVVGGRQNKDIAVLELERAIDAPPVSLSMVDQNHVEDTVYAVGFPGAAAEFLTGITVTRGIISEIGIGLDGLQLYQIDAAINPGNSGGPLFNEDGGVIGINTMKALSEVPTVVRDASGKPVVSVERLARSEGIGFAIRVEELVPELQQAQVVFHTAPSGWWQPVARRFRRDRVGASALALALALGVAACALATTRRGRAVMHEVATRSRRVVSARVSRSGAVPRRRPVLRGLAGPFVGNVVEVGAAPLTLGRDPGACQLVFPPEMQRIGRRHCSLRYDEADRRFILTDCRSVNGTFLGTGAQFKPGESRRLRPGEGFHLANGDVRFEVALEGE